MPLSIFYHELKTLSGKASDCLIHCCLQRDYYFMLNIVNIHTISIN